MQQNSTGPAGAAADRCAARATHDGKCHHNPVVAQAAPWRRGCPDGQTPTRARQAASARITHGAGLPLACFTRHSRLEDQHTRESLGALLFRRAIDEDAVTADGNAMQEGVAACRDGLDGQRK